jgi:hypothetical protein
MTFGTPTRAFAVAKLNKIIAEDDIKNAKEYILGYFIKTVNPVGCLVWNPADDSFRHFRDQEIKERFLQ